jgi:hypothetical protein
LGDPARNPRRMCYGAPGLPKLELRTLCLWMIGPRGPARGRSTHPSLPVEVADGRGHSSEQIKGQDFDFLNGCRCDKRPDCIDCRSVQSARVCQCVQESGSGLERLALRAKAQPPWTGDKRTEEPGPTLGTGLRCRRCKRLVIACMMEVFAYPRRKVQFKILMPFYLWFTVACRSASADAREAMIEASENA